MLNSKGELDALSSCSGAKKVSEHIVGDVGTCSFKGFSHQLCVPGGSQLVSGVCLTQGPQNSCPQMAWGDLRITFHPLVLGQGSPIIHSSREGELGVALESLQGKGDLI